MAFNQIETGYKPEFALGALYQGQNAANAEAMNQEELIRQFLANQQSMQTNPIDVERKQLELDPTRYKSALARFKQDPINGYIPAQIQGQIGQMNTQAAAGTMAKALQPFVQRQKMSESENEKNKQDTLWTIDDIDRQLQQGGGGGTQDNPEVQKFTQPQIGFMTKKRAELLDSLKNTAEFAGKKELRDDQSQASLNAAQIAADSRVEVARLKEAHEKLLTSQQTLAKHMSIVADNNSSPEQKAMSQRYINLFNESQMYKNPGAFNIDPSLSDLSGGKIKQGQMPIERARESMPKPADVKRVKVNNNAEWEKLLPGTLYETATGQIGTR